MSKQPARKEDTLKPGQYLEADNVIIRYMGPKNESGKYEVRVVAFQDTGNKK